MELIIVISIIAIVSIIVLPNYRSGSRLLTLERSAHSLHHDIRRAQEMAMSATEHPFGSGNVPSGFGIVLSENDNYYRIYADTNGDEIFDLNPGDDDIISQIPLEGGVFISSISIGGSGAINFKSPDPTIRIHQAGTNESLGLIRITLRIDPPGATRTITVNSAGSIYLDN